MTHPGCGIWDFSEDPKVPKTYFPTAVFMDMPCKIEMYSAVLLNASVWKTTLIPAYSRVSIESWEGLKLDILDYSFLFLPVVVVVAIAVVVIVIVWKWVP